MPEAEPDAADRRSLHERIAADLRDNISLRVGMRVHA